ncbi:unnamed protein product [Ranitomeya imitator]|uniref:Cation efflux protein transmembrane domain-containing protein n=1 Tax=Ranitomeya imitator TaxID=111125 RepID=A0ABN9LNM4_9NEOB|nr:unnamed protein product [Ranitomeya imitator]
MCTGDLVFHVTVKRMENSCRSAASNLLRIRNKIRNVCTYPEAFRLGGKTLSAIMTVICSNPARLLCVGKKTLKCLFLSFKGTIHLFRKTQRSLLGKLTQEFRLVTSDRRSWKILLFGAINVVCTGFLLTWCSSTNSMALTAYTYLTIFDLFSLITCLISYWVMVKKQSPTYSFGYVALACSLRVVILGLNPAKGALTLVNKSDECDPITNRKIASILNQHGYHSILQRHAIPSGLRLVGPAFIFQQDNDPKHISRLCKGYLTKKESDGVLRQMTCPPQSPDLGFERFEVLSVFASTVLAQLGALFILKESAERFLEQPEIHTGRLLVGTFVALFFNLFTMLSVRNKPFVYVSEGKFMLLRPVFF